MSALGENSAKFSRMFTELRLQTDFRHIQGGIWEARADLRARVANNQRTTRTLPRRRSHPVGLQRHQRVRHPGAVAVPQRQAQRRLRRASFIADLGGVKFDGLRVDYASSRTLT
jgi:hypothetical protein